MDVVGRQFLIYTLNLPALPEFSNHRKKGALLRWNLPNGDFLFADLLTWPEFGQDPLEKELGCFRKGTHSEVIESLWAQAQWEYLARKKNQTLPRAKIDQHFLISHVSQAHSLVLRPDQPVKLKFSGDQFKNNVKWPDWLFGCKNKIRLDLNLSFDESLFSKFWTDLPSEIKSRIEFIEDPFQYNEKSWSLWNDKVPLALDWAESPEKAKDGYSVVVVKSASQNIFNLLELSHLLEKNWVFTHSFDSVVGRTFAEGLAAVVQSQLGSKLKACGFHPPEPMIGDFDFTSDENRPGLGFSEAFKNLLWSDPVGEK